MKKNIKKSLDILEKYEISKYAKQKINNVFPLFNLILIFNIMIMAISIGIIIAHYVL